MPNAGCAKLRPAEAASCADAGPALRQATRLVVAISAAQRRPGWCPDQRKARRRFPRGFRHRWLTHTSEHDRQARSQAPNHRHICYVVFGRRSVRSRALATVEDFAGKPVDDSKAMTKDGAQSTTASASTTCTATSGNETGRYRVITFDRPAARNALDVAATATLTDADAGHHRDADTYAIVMRSSRLRAGGDVRRGSPGWWRQNLPAKGAGGRGVPAHLADGVPVEARYLADRPRWRHRCRRRHHPHQYAPGGGRGLLVRDAPEVRLGLFRTTASPMPWRACREQQGKYLALTGRRLQRADQSPRAGDALSSTATASRRSSSTSPTPRSIPCSTGCIGHRRRRAGRMAGLDRRLLFRRHRRGMLARLAAHALPAARTQGAWAAAALADLDLGSPLALKVALSSRTADSRALDLRPSA